MDLRFSIGSLFFLFGTALSMYSSSDDVIELTDANFNSEVIKSDGLWLVEFYAPWCGHCKNLAPEWKKAATQLKGMVHVGAVDADKYQSLGGRYGVQGFPTIKIFGANKNSPKDYNGGRDASSIVEQAFTALRQMVKEKSSGGGGSQGGSDDDDRDSGSNDVVELTESNFNELVLNSKESWLVEFFAPWCGHCKRLEPEWKAAATEVKSQTGGAVKLGAVDATIHQGLASRYGVRGYPTIKVFRQGFKDEPPLDYEGGRDKSGIVAKAMELYTDNIEPPSVDEIVNQQSVKDACDENQLCIIAFLENILDSMAKGRNEKLEMMARLADKFKAKRWGWLWAEGGKLPDLEKALDIGGFGYPAVAAVNVRKEMYTIPSTPFTEDGMTKFLSSLSTGRAGRHTNNLPNGKIPDIPDQEPWDGQDGKLPEEDDVDLSDFSWDDEEDTKKDEL